ncbi:MAG: ROK family protein [Bacilli bacterium]|nr:ROK family protein [Bacilli bacterium]
MKKMSLKYNLNLDPKFQPMVMELREFKAKVAKAAEKTTVSFCVERNNGYRYRYDLDVIPGDPANVKMVERLLKSILWVVGGYKIYINGPKDLTDEIVKIFSMEGSRAFDVEFMSRVYRNKFEVVVTEDVPASVEASIKVGGHLDGCRIGFDAGGSDRKVSAVVNGEVIYSEEVVWFPKTNEDPNYHYEGILDSFNRAASKMPRVDAIGVSSAGIYIDNEVRVASLFVKVPQDKFDAEARDIYIRAAKQFGDVPLQVVNDGDVTALAGALSLEDTKILGIAMGTSEAVGYINTDGNINGWLSELAFVPVDYNEDAMVDEWSGDYGCGVKYFSQDGVIKLAKNAGIELDEALSPAEKLKVVQGLMANDDPRAKEIYETIGVYLGYTIPYYAEFYDIKYLLLLGRVTSGKGGDLIIEKANEVLKEVFPEFNVQITTPDEKMRRVGQSIAAASLPATK